MFGVTVRVPHFFRLLKSDAPVKLAIERVQALADISCSELYAFAVYKALSVHTCVLSWQRNLCTDCKTDNSAQLEVPRTIPPSYIWFHAVVWKCSEGQTHRWSCPICILPWLCLARNVIGSRPSDHYFRSVCLFVCLSVCLFVQSFSQPSLIRF